MTYRELADKRAMQRSRVRAREESGSSQISDWFKSIGSTVGGWFDSPEAPTAPTYDAESLNQALLSPTAYADSDPRMGYQQGADYGTPAPGFNEPGVFATPTLPGESNGIRTGGSEAWQPREQQVNDPWNYQQETLDLYNKEMANRQAEVDGLTSSAAGITAALQAQADMLSAQRDQALTQGLNATAAKYNQQLAEIDKQIGKIKTDQKNNEDISAWLRSQMSKPFDLAKAAAEAIDTAAATAGMEAAIENVTAAKLESDARLQSALEDIGFEGLVGQIGIEAAQDMVAENAFLNEQYDVMEAEMAYKDEIASFERDLFIANADKDRATFNREDETNRMLTAKSLREALSDTLAQKEKVELAKKQALDKVRQDIGRQFGEGVTLPSEGEFVQMALQSQWDIIAADLPDEDLGVYYDMYLELEALGLDFQDEHSLRRYLLAEQEAAAERGQVFDFDMEDIAILRQMDAVITGAYEEYNRVKTYQGSVTGANNRDPNNRAEVDHWLKTGEITGPYAERAAAVDSFADDIRSRFGIEVQGDRYLRPVPQSKGEVEGQAFNSDHQCAGALDLFFTPGTQDSAKYKEVEAYVQTLKAQGVVSSVVWMGQNAAHHDHIHVSFALPYGGQKQFTPDSLGENVQADKDVSQAVAENQRFRQAAGR